jgi:hypothetical protein
MSVALASERFRASGGFAGEGVRRLMGAPNLSLLQTVIRESLQNSCDAGAGEGPIRTLVRLRTLQADEVAALRETFADLPEGSPSRLAMAATLAQDTPLVMEICDWGTVGLGGPTRADEAPPDAARMDFVNFIRNVGAARDTDQGGGTYGYGKTALYLTSGCGAIVVDTLTLTAEGPQRRLIGCQLGEAYARDGVRYTGRNWWGEAAGEDLVEPLTGEAAVRLASRLGLPEREDGATGTSIMILDPDLGGETTHAAVSSIEEIILWFFWPKMIDAGAGPAMTFSLEDQTGVRSVRHPDEVAPLDLFADAYRKLRSGGADVREIRSQRPAQRLGRLAVRRGFRTPRIRFRETDPLIPHTCRHIAVMRPVELVVRYYEGRELPDERQEWAGVFICDSDPIVERAFADSEPPAHDDWIPENLPRGHAKTFVRVAIRELINVAAAAGGTARAAPGAGAQGPSLARAADSMARLLGGAGAGHHDFAAGSGGAGARGDTGGGATCGGSAGGSRRGGRARADAPVFISLEAAEGHVEALFDVRAANPTGAGAVLRARPGLVIDGVLTTETDAPRGQVRVLGWETQDGDTLGGGPVLDLAAESELRVRVRVAVPPGAVAGLAVDVEGAA